MSSRLDRLLILLDTGSSTSVRTTAAKQLAQLAAKSVRSDVGGDDDVTKYRQHVSSVDPAEWAELMSVVARVLPYLHSRSHETRVAASVALSQICSLVPLWEPPLIDDDTAPTTPIPAPEFPAFSIKQLMENGTLLLASSGKEFTKPNGIFTSAAEVQKARKAAMGRLGLDFLDNVTEGDDMDWEKELAAADQDASTPDTKADDTLKQEAEEIKVDSPTESPAVVKKESTPSDRQQSVTPAAADNDMSGLSARERNRLKRKRKPGNTAFVAAPPPPQNSNAKYAATPSGPSNSKARVVASENTSQSRSEDCKSNANTETPERVIIDPSKGGAVDPKATAAQQSKALEVQPGHWVWDGVVRLLEVDLFSAAWEVRHGAAMALRELLKVQGKCGGMKAGASSAVNQNNHEAWCNALAAKCLCVFVLDRFGDFVSDQVVAPVRETVSQTLASLLLHMPRRSVMHVHSILLQMIRQDFTITPPKPDPALKGAKSHNGKVNGKSHVWEVRHAGLLGIKYEVAVRSDFIEGDAIKLEDDAPSSGRDILKGILEAAVLGLGDGDDDVRSVAASCLLPITNQLVDHIPAELPRVLAVLWSCLADMKDDLSSSVGAVMDLLGKLVTHNRVIEILANPETSQPLTVLAPTLFAFFRHTIPNVRLAVVKTLHSFLTVTSLPRDWVDHTLLRLLVQNLVVEERIDIRESTLSLWQASLLMLRSEDEKLESTVWPQLALEWYTLVMTPLGVPIEPSTLYYLSAGTDGHGVTAERHNVDKNMLAQDLSLVSVETVLKARVAATTALAWLIAEWPPASCDAMFRPMLEHYIQSTSMLQQFLGAVVVEEWCRRYDEKSLTTEGKTYKPIVEVSTLASDISQKILSWLQNDTPVAYHEMALSLSRIFIECTNLLQSFVHDCKVPASSLPSLGGAIDITGSQEGCFTINIASAAVGPMFEKLKDSLGRTKKKELAAIQEKRQKVIISIDRYKEIKVQHDIRVSAAFASAFVALKVVPDKVSPIVKGIMNGVKNEENIDLQTRSASAVASFIEFCTQNQLPQPPEKIVKNLCTFLCQDAEQTPTFAVTKQTEKGILSFKSSGLPDALSNGKNGHRHIDDAEELSKARLSRRGAEIALVQLSKKFGGRLFEFIPKMWDFIAGGLLTTYASDSPSDADKLMEKQFGQDVIDSLSVLKVTAATLHEDLWPRLVDLLPKLTLALRSRFAIIRQCTARCFATICNVVTVRAMRHVIEHVVPLLGDSVSVTNRQGAIELIYHIVQELDIRALPYVIFLVVPILGRMSDPDDSARATATNTFASLVKMVPLEAGLPDPPDFSDELLQRRDQERQFLTQLLDGKKVEQYNIPVKINAELRKYQQEGVNWLAFLAKYQLHGILCDDMGLGKTLQSICILASKHHERAERYKSTKSPDSVHLPSLIICPPTLTGHWYCEILKYAENLRPMMYVGNARERNRLLSKLGTHDVVITSYEVVRNDIHHLQGLVWHYCVLDEGHIIKNAKTKLTKAVKAIRANHRLILSGTPIQNNVLELWSLFDFLMPGFLGTEHSFNERFSKPILSNRDGKSKNGEAAALALEALHKQVLPFLLRRLKEDVLHDLPPKIIQDYYCELSELQKYLYDDFSKSQAAHSVEDVLHSQSSEKEAKGEQRHVFQSLHYLRKLCNHPALVFKDDAEAIKSALAHVQEMTDSHALHDIQHAPKLQALRQLLLDCGIGTTPSVTADPGKSELLDTEQSSSGVFSQHRVLIFCQLKQMLDIIETDLFKKYMPSVTYMRLDGGTDANKRHAIVQTFNADPSIDCLLLTTHVGGLGLTLTGADTVIFVEHDWNPMKDLQAMDRAHRIGQKKVVNVYRLITKGTLEEKIMGLQRFKLNIANSVVTQQNSGLASMDTDLVLDLFKRTTEEEDAAAAKKRKEKEKSGPVGQKAILEGLDDLPTEEEYDGLNLSNFMGSLGR
ncbi:SNF2 chromatin remodeling protein [Rickenella mellea]|uniref:TATA-binding protein-associated factor mot1 n=1 Tax=Rickenella mellea TaxID=50990 RepID=A0A4Y7QJM9_9AGAM|nr:SNF2 chromatin remodeling protein [Rickenella mellea]